ncbi:MAG: thiamine ABC transporter substrate-binding protein [Anaerolineales bacterium]|nr:MAG: thiamine ABC transporter substrate-binding protein [Anaerolineales bacterium]
MKHKLFLPLAAFCTLLAACAPQAAPSQPSAVEASIVTEAPTPSAPLASGEPVPLTVMTHDSFSISEAALAAFEQANNVKVTFVKSGDAGSTLNKAILSKDAPLADVLYGVDNAFLARALDAGIFEPYESPALVNAPAEFRLDPENRATPVDYGDVCINYDRAFFAKNELAVPQTLDDLIRPEYNGMLVVENPATSSPGLAFLLATIAHFGEPGYLDFWRSLRANGLVVVNDWNAAYYTNFSASSGRGPQPMVVSYATSPAAEVIYSDAALEQSPTASIVGPDTCFRQIEFVGILAGTRQRAAAERFVDFMLSLQFQEDLPLQMFVLPVDPMAILPDSFHQFNEYPDQPATLAPDVIAANRERWIQEWTDAVLR